MEIFQTFQSIVHNLIFEGFTVSLKYTQSLLDLFEYFEAPSFGFKQNTLNEI